MKEQVLPSVPELFALLNEYGHDLKRAARKVAPTLGRLTAALALLAAYARPVQSADKNDGIAPLALDPTDLPQLFQIQINFNRPDRINDHTVAIIYWGHPWLAGMEIPGDPNSPFKIQWDGAMKWWISQGAPPMDETHFWVQDNEGSIPGLVIFDATQDVDRASSGCWPEGYAGPYKGPMFGVYFPVGATVPWGYAGNTTDFPLRALAHDNDTNTDLDPIDVNPNDAYSFPASWNFTVILVNLDNGQECGRFTYNLSWAKPVPTPTPSPTPTETEIPPTATPTSPPPTVTPTHTSSPSPTPTETEIPPTATPTSPPPTATPTHTSSPSSTPTETDTPPPTATPGKVTFRLYLPIIQKQP